MASPWIGLARHRKFEPKQLAHLRQTAVPDAAGPLEVLVALPADQIKAFGSRPLPTPAAQPYSKRWRVKPLMNSANFAWIATHTAQGQTIAAIAQETLEEAEDFTEAFGFKAVGFVALPGGAWENNFAVFERSGSRTQNRPSAYIVAAQETKAADVTPLAALAQSAVPAPKLSARAADQAAPTPKISANPTAEIDIAPPPLASRESHQRQHLPGR